MTLRHRRSSTGTHRACSATRTPGLQRRHGLLRPVAQRGRAEPWLRGERQQQRLPASGEGRGASGEWLAASGESSLILRGEGSKKK